MHLPKRRPKSSPPLMYSRSSAGASTPMLQTKMIGLPESPHRDRQAACIGSRTIDQAARIRNGTAQCNRQSGATNYSNRGGSLFLNVFIPVQALLLSSLRILRPRGSRGEHADYPHGVCGAWPRARQIRDPDSAVNRTRTQTVRVREQSMPAFSPAQTGASANWQRSRQCSGLDSPRTGSVHGLELSADSPQP